MGRGAYGGTLCGPVFADFMKVALEMFPVTEHEKPPGSVFIKIDRFNGEPGYGSYGEFIDGGFVMGRDLLFFDHGDTETFETIVIGGEQIIIPAKPTFGGLTSGGLY